MQGGREQRLGDEHSRLAPASIVALTLPAVIWLTLKITEPRPKNPHGH